MSFVLEPQQQATLERRARAESEAALDEYFLRSMAPRYVRTAPEERQRICRDVLNFADATGLTTPLEIGKLLEVHVEYGLHRLESHVNDEVRTILYRMDLPGEQRLYVLSELLAEGSAQW